MADIVDKATRSRMMAGIRGKDTRPERVVRSFLHRQGFRFRLQYTRLPGRPDLVLPRYRAAVFVHGCFWHRHPGCRFAYMPATNRRFWRAKLEGNAERDKGVRRELRALGWKPLVIWECQVGRPEALARLTRAIKD